MMRRRGDEKALLADMGMAMVYSSKFIVSFLLSGVCVVGHKRASNCVIVSLIPLPTSPYKHGVCALLAFVAMESQQAILPDADV